MLGLGSISVWCLMMALAVASDPPECHDYVLISSRGTFEQQGPSIGFVGMINNTLQAVPNGIEYDTVYPASTNLSGAFVGVADIIRYITSGIESCPQQTYGLLGYSQGASVTDISLHNFTDQSSTAYHAIKAVVVIGNPGHVYGALANVDQNGSDTTRNFTGSYYLNGAGAIPDQYYSDDKVLDICYQGDLVCALPPNETFAIKPPHLLYGSTPSVQSMGAEFLIRKLGGSSNNTSASTGSCSATASLATASSMTTGASVTALTSVCGAGTTSAQNSAPAVATHTGAGALVQPPAYLPILGLAIGCIAYIL